MLRAVLFDLDDTLFDHHGCARDALSAVRDGHACFSAVRFEDLERAHARYLEELHREVMVGRLPLEDARRERFRRLFGAAGVPAGDDLADLAATTYRDRYREARRAVPGVGVLLPLVKARARVGVVSNNLLAEQREKVVVCGLDVFIDTLVVSEEAGVAKPDPAIFGIALGRLGCRADEAVMVGDSWSADVAGARAAGIRAIWFNRSGEAPPEDDRSIAQLRALEPADAVLRVIFDANRG
jgi:putative hydrolase of the HAD superfamily